MTDSQTTQYALFFRKKQISVWHPSVMQVIYCACDNDAVFYDKGGVSLRELWRIDERKAA